MNVNQPSYVIGQKTNTMYKAQKQSSLSISLFFFFLIIVIVSASYTKSHAATIYVKHNASGSNNGNSWTNAYVALQDAINAASSGDELWVAAGTYKPTRIPSTGATSSSSRDLSFYLDKNIKIYGGFAGTETLLSQRNISANQVTLSGDIGTIGSSSDNCYHVFMMDGLSTSAVLNGFVITGGNANASGSFWGTTQSFSGQNFPKRAGGGITTLDSDLDIDNVVITDNNSIEYGGGCFFMRSELTMDNSVIYNNSAVYGGGIYAFQQTCNPKLTNVTICYNSASDATHGGGGIYANSANYTLKNVLFWGNTKAGNDNVSGADILSYGTVTRSYCMTQTNSSWSSGTGMLTAGTNPSFINSSDPDGADNTWMTLDDGLVLNSTSSGVGAGTSTLAPSNDITGKARATSPSIGAYEGRTCKKSNNLPTASGTYTSSFTGTDGNFTCYCDNNQKLILGLNLISTGAVVPTSGVSLQIGATTTTTYTNAGGIITNSNGGVVFNRKWNVAPTTQPTSDVTVLYPFTNTEYTAIVSALASRSTTITNANQLQMYKLTSSGTFADPHANGATGVILTHAATASTANWVYSSHSNGTDHLATYKVSSFSGGGGGGGASGNPLPVDLMHFDVHAMNNHEASLHWATASEINNSHFNVERSYDGRTFEVIGEVAGNGNSQHLIEYSYSDETIAPLENTVFYRLKQVDFDGAYEYSDIRVVRFDEVGHGIDFSAYPNPMNDELSLIVSLLNGEAYQIDVTDLQGSKVHHENHTFTNGIHKLNTSEWNSGMYILQVATDKGSKYVKVMKE
ncbi:MAG: T9SS type A sorting domain-containing protein [Bacteroidia bacterium]|nr:T9SS type A sorting domain-containing protein [Bacteroidia bacterium]